MNITISIYLPKGTVKTYTKVNLHDVIEGDNGYLTFATSSGEIITVVGLPYMIFKKREWK